MADAPCPYRHTVAEHRTSGGCVPPAVPPRARPRRIPRHVLVERWCEELSHRLYVDRRDTDATEQSQAENAGVSRSSVYRLKTGRPPSMFVFIALLRYLEDREAERG